MYMELKPKSWTSHYIDAYWLFQNGTDEEIESIIRPDGSTDIIIPLQDTLSTPRVVGCMTYGHKILIAPKQKMLGIRFKPGFARAFLHVPLLSLQNNIIPLDCFHTYELSYFQEEVQFHSFHLYIDQIELELQKHFLAKNIDPIVLYAIAQLKKHRGAISIDSVALAIGISKRTLERKFNENVGLSPKMLARIIRFQNVYKELKKSGNCDLSTLAFKAGYYDQAHFNKEYKLFAGITPGQTLNKLART